MVDVVKDVDYSTLSEAEREEALGEAYKAHDYKLMRVIVTASQKAEDAARKAAKDALQAELAGKTSMVKGLFDAIKVMLTSGEPVTADIAKGFTNKLKGISGTELDGADGIWYIADFGSTESGCKLTKSAPRKATRGAPSGKSSYVSNPTKSADLLAQVGDRVYFNEDTKVTINKVDQTMPAGMTFKEAFDFSTNGGWRNRVRMALLKEAGLI